MESTGFSENRKQLERARELSHDDLVALEQSILADPQAGDLVPGTGGLRKIRLGQPKVGRGKRGGVRVYYLDLPRRGVTHLVAIREAREVRPVAGGAPGRRSTGEAAQGGDVMKRKTGKSSAFAKLKAGLEDAIAYHRGAKQLTVRDVELKPPPPMGAKEVLAVRAQLRVSQAAFARILNVSPRTVQAWETNARRPSDAALKLLSVAKKNPEVLLR